jgi:hypothetical protein
MSAKPDLVGDIWKLAERIEAKPVERPDFTPTTKHSLASWVVANDIDLCNYWQALARCAPLTSEDCTFAEFCAVQYERQEREEEEAAEFSHSDYLAAEADSKYGNDPL